MEAGQTALLALAACGPDEEGYLIRVNHAGLAGRDEIRDRLSHERDPRALTVSTGALRVFFKDRCGAGDNIPGVKFQRFRVVQEFGILYEAQELAKK